MFSFWSKSRVRKIKKKNSNNYFENRRWQFLQLLEELSGVWPYQNEIKQYLLETIHFCAIASIFLAVANKFADLKGNDTVMAIECVLFMMFLFGLTGKLVSASIYKNKRRKIFVHVAKHFKTITNKEEVEVLEEFADRGFKCTIIFLCFIILIVSVFDSVPVLRSFYTYFFENTKLDVALPLPMNYGFDHQKYWYIITFDFLMFVFSGILSDFSYDLSFILQIHHIQALFKIVGMRLNRASELFIELGEEAADDAYSLISSAIDLHSECLEIVGMIEEAYTINWFVVLMINTGGLGATMHVISSKFHDPIESFRYLCGFVLVIIHFHLIFTQGQAIIDSSSSVSEACYACKWYNLPKKSSKLLMIMMIRTSLPCQISGAQLFPLSTETFGKMLKAGLSYYTVFQA